MKKIILCIIISFILLSHATICAQERGFPFSKSTENLYTSEAYKKDIEGSLWAVTHKASQEVNPDFYKNITLKTTVFNNPKINYLPTTDNANSAKPMVSTANVILQGDSESIQLHESCTPFIISMSLLFVMIIVFIIARRIKTDTLKLF